MSFLAGKQNFVVQKGATWHEYVVWMQDANTPHDLTGKTARMEIREREGGPLIIEVLCLIDNPTNGRIDLWIHVPFTLDVKAKDYRYDLELVTFNAYTVGNNHYDDVIRLIQGKVKIVDNITQP